MSVIKAHARGDVRPPPAAVPRAAEPEIVSEDPRIADLTARLEDARATLTAFREQAKIEIAAAREKGAQDARVAEASRIAAIEQGVVDAVDLWRDRLTGLECLAAQLASIALAKLFDDQADLAEMVARTLANQMRAIDAAAAVRVRVSAADFGDAAALDALAERCGLPPAAIVAEPDAPAGACEIDLAVGHIDLSIDGQWRAIERGLAAIIAEGRA